MFRSNSRILYSRKIITRGKVSCVSKLTLSFRVTIVIRIHSAFFSPIGFQLEILLQYETISYVKTVHRTISKDIQQISYNVTSYFNQTVTHLFIFSFKINFNRNTSKFDHRSNRNPKRHAHKFPGRPQLGNRRSTLFPCVKRGQLE